MVIVSKFLGDEEMDVAEKTLVHRGQDLCSQFLSLTRTGTQFEVQLPRPILCEECEVGDHRLVWKVANRITEHQIRRAPCTGNQLG